jgi:hypothetical protein
MQSRHNKTRNFKKGHGRKNPRKDTFSKEGSFTTENSGKDPVSSEHVGYYVYTALWVISNGAASTAAVRIPFNCLYGIDPDHYTTGAVAYRDEMMDLYNYYRTLAIDEHIIVTNIEPTLPVHVFLLKANTPPSSSGAGYYLRSGDPFGQSKLLDPMGGGHASAVFRSRNTSCAIQGSKSPLFDDTYRGTVGTDPTDKIWSAIGIDTGTGDHLTNGVAVNYRIRMKVRFYGRKILASMSRPLPLPEPRDDDDLRKRIEELILSSKKEST